MRVSSNGIMLALALVFFAQVTERSEGPAYLHFLARHQLSDGSWGLRPDGCTCPDVERVVAPCDLREKNQSQRQHDPIRRHPHREIQPNFMCPEMARSIC